VEEAVVDEQLLKQGAVGWESNRTALFFPRRLQQRNDIAKGLRIEVLFPHGAIATSHTPDVPAVIDICMILCRRMLVFVWMIDGQGTGEGGHACGHHWSDAPHIISAPQLWRCGGSLGACNSDSADATSAPTRPQSHFILHHS